MDRSEVMDRSGKVKLQNMYSHTSTDKGKQNLAAWSRKERQFTH